MNQVYREDVVRIHERILIRAVYDGRVGLAPFARAASPRPVGARLSICEHEWA